MSEGENKKKKTLSAKDSKAQAPIDQPKRKNNQEGSDFRDKVGDFANKGLQVLKTGAQKITHFTGSATKLSKLKLEIHQLQGRCDEIYHDVGKRLWQMHKDNKDDDVSSVFVEQLKEMADLQKQIAAKDQQVEKISLTE